MSYFLATRPVDNVEEEEASCDIWELSGRGESVPDVTHSEKTGDGLTESVPGSQSSISQKKGKLRQKSYTYEDRAKSHSKQCNPLRTGGKIFKCESCLKSFSVRSKLMEHLKMHTGEKPYACDLCNKSFSTCQVLTIHRRTHTGENPYACDLCSRSFPHRTGLYAHRIIHTGEKPYGCDSCHETFAHRTGLSAHRKNSH